MCMPTPFNGAATCSLRNARAACYWRAPSVILQWGRNLFVAECSQAGSLFWEGVNPSMGPQLVRCGMVTRSFESIAGRGPSMGPQLVRCGMPTVRSRRAPSRQTFNGAATCSLRNAAKMPGSAGRRSLLQWGRNLFVAECYTYDRYAAQQAKPSMGPQLVRCGMTNLLSLNISHLSLLQWGRNLFVAECSVPQASVSGHTNLQWGRNLFVAEC